MLAFDGGLWYDNSCNKNCIRVWRSLVARLNGVQEAAGSTPVTRTTLRLSKV